MILRQEVLNLFYRVHQSTIRDRRKLNLKIKLIFEIMVRKVFIVCLFITGCTSGDCLKNSNVHLRFQKLFKADDKLLTSSSREDIAAYKGDEKLRDSIFSKICVARDSAKKLIFLRKIAILNDLQTGLIYIYNYNKLFYFYKRKDSSIIVGEGTNNYEDLTKVFNIIKGDFYKNSSKLKEYFEKKGLADVPVLQLAFVDISNTEKVDSLIEFSFGTVMDGEFDKEFEEK